MAVALPCGLHGQPLLLSGDEVQVGLTRWPRAALMLPPLSVQVGPVCAVIWLFVFRLTPSAPECERFVLAENINIDQENAYR